MNTILKLSLAGSILGIFLLLFLSNFLVLPLTPIEEIDDRVLNKKVRIQGTVFKVEDKEGFQIISIKDKTGKIDVLSDSQLKEFYDVEVEGRVREYRGYLQIQADKITKL